jgi:hypothetical protein
MTKLNEGDYVHTDSGTIKLLGLKGIKARVWYPVLNPRYNESLDWTFFKIMCSDGEERVFVSTDFIKRPRHENYS